jgi:hypothetical protein
LFTFPAEEETDLARVKRIPYLSCCNSERDGR